MSRKLLICVAILFLVSSGGSSDFEIEPTKIHGFWDGIYTILIEYASDVYNALASVQWGAGQILNSIGQLIATLLLNIQNTILAVIVKVTLALQSLIPDQLGGDTLDHLNEKKAFCYTNNTQSVIVKTLQSGVECVKSPIDKLVDNAQKMALNLYGLVLTVADEVSQIKNSQGLSTTVDAVIVLIKTKAKFLFEIILEIIVEVVNLLNGIPSIIVCFFPSLVIKVIVWLGKEIGGFTKCLLFEKV
ncbi:hypothetical protein MTP99_005036 [Tenebrio molitor]|nr:hypothetical protein MTP99_005036 [Tenebrio molitor]CAH1381064.1 unnamed protein product [Tenebrio molitor]